MRHSSYVAFRLPLTRPLFTEPQQRCQSLGAPNLLPSCGTTPPWRSRYAQQLHIMKTIMHTTTRPAITTIRSRRTPPMSSHRLISALAVVVMSVSVTNTTEASHRKRPCGQAPRRTVVIRSPLASSPPAAKCTRGISVQGTRIACSQQLDDDATHALGEARSSAGAKLICDRCGDLTDCLEGGCFYAMELHNREVHGGERRSSCFKCL